MTINLEKIPSNPGCYLFINKRKEIIYIGKAKNLKKRVSSYFNNKDLNEKTKVLVTKIDSIDFIVTDSEVEALLLENNLIKKHKPKYNINLKDSKSYAFIEITKESFPRLLVARTELMKKEKIGGDLFGPFPSAESRRYTINFLNKIFKLRTCKKLPKKKCIRYDLNLCSAPCINKISKKEYLENVSLAKKVLKGDINFAIKNLDVKMQEASNEKEFERAINFRNGIHFLNQLKEKQKVERSKKYNEDIINYIIVNEKVYLMIFNIHKGILENKRSFKFNEKEDFLEEFITQYYSEEKIPKSIILPKKVSNLAIEFLSIKNKSKIQIKVPRKGELKGLLDLVKRNIEIYYFGNFEKVNELKKALNFQFTPKVIECFDISHLSGTEVVAGMVQFRNGKADKANYRRFKIKSFQGNDDFRAMKEVIKRRYSRLKKENKVMPDLVIIDGGAGQLSSSIKALKEIEVNIPIISLAKKEEEIYFPNGKILKLNPKNKGLLLLRQIRDEAHRFAIKFQRERRNKKFFEKR